ncbi:hypothetical protein QCD79_34530, partial [Pseudomonas quasicaspiana]|nr:hypothetical protein [Pseudomonas quasicaspiana]
LQIVPGDTYLLCSDGLNKTAEDHEIRDVLGHSDPYQAAHHLIRVAVAKYVANFMIFSGLVQAVAAQQIGVA